MRTGVAGVSFAAGLATAAVVEVVVLVRGYLGVHPSNVAGHVALVWVVSVLSGVVIGVQLVRHRPPVSEMLGRGVIATMGWFVGIAAAEMAWTLGGELLTGGERGMHLLNIPYIGVHGALPLLTGVLGGVAAMRAYRLRRPGDRMP